MSLCPCCSEVLLRHARHNGIYWFCTHCWQEMPAVASETLASHSTTLKQAENGLMFSKR
ncbi:MAG: hypothetical protein RBJ76_13030 [Stenomitos frigidus ULC029]